MDITDIRKGLPGISSIAAQQLYETFEVCMHVSKHPEDVKLVVEGDVQKVVDIHWQDEYNDQKERTYADMQYTTEHGAICLSVMLTTSFTPYTIIERSRKGTGFDYWLGDKNSILFQKKARLEVSGILNGDDAVMKSRHASKVMQTDKSDNLHLPAYISVIEFSRPKALFTKK
ncbi:MAG: hypothetical protein IKR31_08030 [Prevotella sp.]|nr:hypothetical protein [Prevotella sp.]